MNKGHSVPNAKYQRLGAPILPVCGINTTKDGKATFHLNRYDQGKGSSSIMLERKGVGKQVSEELLHDIFQKLWETL